MRPRRASPISVAARARQWRGARARPAARASPLRSLPRPSRLEAPLSSLRGRRPEARRPPRRDRDRDARRPARARPARLPRPRRRARGRRAADRRGGDGRWSRCARRAVRPTRRRGPAIVEANVADATGPMKAIWFNQAWLAERLTPGTTAAAARQARPLAASASPTTSSSPEAAAGRSAPALHTTGIVPVHPATRDGSRPQRLREWAWQARRARAATRSSRCRPSCAPGDGLPARPMPLRRRPLPATRRPTPRPPAARLAFEELFLHQAALAMRRGARREARPADRARARRASWSRAGSTRCPSS